MRVWLILLLAARFAPAYVRRRESHFHVDMHRGAQRASHSCSRPPGHRARGTRHRYRTAGVPTSWSMDAASITHACTLKPRPAPPTAPPCSLHSPARCKIYCNTKRSIPLNQAILALTTDPHVCSSSFRPQLPLPYEHVFCSLAASTLAQRTRTALSLTRSFLLLEDDDNLVAWEIDREREPLDLEPNWASAHRTRLRGRQAVRRSGQALPRPAVCLCPVSPVAPHSKPNATDCPKQGTRLAASGHVDLLVATYGSQSAGCNQPAHAGLLAGTGYPPMPARTPPPACPPVPARTLAPAHTRASKQITGQRSTAHHRRHPPAAPCASA